MTLVVTRFAKCGLVMVADSAVTCGKGQDAVIQKTTKLYQIEQLKAGISVWGKGNLGSTDTSDWVKNFIDDNEESAAGSIEVFANRLATAASTFFTNDYGDKRQIGFHVAGYETDVSGALLPSLWHVHDDRQGHDRKIGEDRIVARQDKNVSSLRKLFSKDQAWELRNGTIDQFAELPLSAFKTLEELRHETVCSVQCVVESYSQKNPRTIAGPLNWLTVDPEGRIKFDVVDENPKHNNWVRSQSTQISGVLGIEATGISIPWQSKQ